MKGAHERPPLPFTTEDTRIFLAPHQSSLEGAGFLKMKLAYKGVSPALGLSAHATFTAMGGERVARVFTHAARASFIQVTLSSLSTEGEEVAFNPTMLAHLITFNSPKTKALQDSMLAKLKLDARDQLTKIVTMPDQRLPEIYGPAPLDSPLLDSLREEDVVEAGRNAPDFRQRAGSPRPQLLPGHGHGGRARCAPAWLLRRTY